MSALALLSAQIAAEVKTRLRSTSTAVAVVAILVASFKWIPDPASGAVSIAWGEKTGVSTSGIYNSAYVGASAAVLAALFLSLIGFYLVTGSIRRDRQSGVGVILAATPLSSAAYLAGKIAAHTVYLWTISLVSLAGGFLVFLRFGVGGFAPLAFLMPWLYFVAPAMVFVAALAVFFDATPGLRGVGGYIAYFFFWCFGLLILPGLSSGGMNAEGGSMAATTPYYDPIAMGAILQMLQEATDSQLGDVAIGLQYGVGKLNLIDWQGFHYSLRWLGIRLLTLLWVGLPFGAALFFFDRFDPARKRAGRREAASPAGATSLSEAGASGTGNGNGDRAPAPRLSLASLPPILAMPSALRSILAEAKILWDGAGFLRFLLPPAALAAALPGEAGLPGAAALLLLLAPALAEAAARESLAGTWPLILGQPGVPRSAVLWKLGAALLFVLALGLPRLLFSLAWPELAAGWLLGLVFVAGFAVAAGFLSKGGKLFIGFYLALWYSALNGAPFADFAAAMTPAPALATSAIYAGIGLASIGFAFLVEKRRFALA